MSNQQPQQSKTPKGSNEHDVQIVEIQSKAKATNEHDVEIANVNLSIEQVRKEASLEIERYKADKEHQVAKLRTYTDLAKGLGYAAAALTGYIVSVQANKDVRKYEIEFGEK